jgi:hypothetical protein
MGLRIVTLTLFAAAALGVAAMVTPPAHAATAIAEIRGAGLLNDRQVDAVSASVSSVGSANPVPDRASASADAPSGVLRAEASEWGGGGSFPVNAFASLAGNMDFTNSGTGIFNLQIMIDGYSDPFAWRGPTHGLPEGGVTTTFLNAQVLVNEHLPGAQGSGLRLDYTHSTATVLTADPVLGGIIDVDARETFNQNVIRQPVIGGARQSYVGQETVTFLRNPSPVGYAVLIEIPLTITAGQGISFDVFGSLAPLVAGATAHGARADMSNSMHFGFTADPGVSFTSPSGIFLRDIGSLTPASPVPLPGSVFGLLTALLMLGMARRNGVSRRA